MSHILFTSAIEVTFFTGIALRFSQLDEYYRKKGRQNFKKRLLHSIKYARESTKEIDKRIGVKVKCTEK